MQRVLYTFLLLSFFIAPGNATDCFNGRYKNKVFSEYTVLNNIIYARKQTSDGRWQNLGYDVYQPKNDTVSSRPVVVLAHGGGYIDLLDQKSHFLQHYVATVIEGIPQERDQRALVLD